MKNPRVEDFDPNAKERTLKSSMDGFPPIEKRNEPNSEAKPPPVPPVRVVPPVPRPKLTKTGKRVIKQRHPFDIYQDQYESLVELAMEERKGGGVGSMSAMVREALDTFIAERKKK